VARSIVYADAEEDLSRHMWIESEKAGQDPGGDAIRTWAMEHWWGYLRARWLEHLQGKRFWVELDRKDFGLLQRKFKDRSLLLDRVLDRLDAGRQSLDVLVWAADWGIPAGPVLEILTAIDVNGRRLAHRLSHPDAPAVTLDPAWLAWNDGTVVRLARGMWDEGAFDRLPILGDALQEAGCDDAAVLGHCRSGGPDARSSWLVDLIVWGL
jgi:hypothetical protein